MLSNMREPVCIHAGAINDKGISFPLATYWVILKEKQRSASSLYWFNKTYNKVWREVLC